MDEQAVWDILAEVKDPEIPVVSVVEMGLVRQVLLQEDSVQITLTPTFAGCPALGVMRTEIMQRLAEAGMKNVEVKFSLSTPWSSDWITPAARQKLKDFGLAPPPQHGGFFEAALLRPVACPHCGSTDTTLKNSFGPTLCRAIYTCNHCKEPFEQFKPI